MQVALRHLARLWKTSQNRDTYNLPNTTGCQTAYEVSQTNAPDRGLEAIDAGHQRRTQTVPWIACGAQQRCTQSLRSAFAHR